MWRLRGVLTSVIIYNLISINKDRIYFCLSFTSRHPNKCRVASTTLPSPLMVSRCLISPFSSQQNIWTVVTTSTIASRKRRKSSSLCVTNNKDNNTEDDKDISNKNGSFIDAVVEEDAVEGNSSSEISKLIPYDENMEATPNRKRKMETFKSILRKLASLSLQDYKWRSEVFKSNQADRMMEQTLARMRGVEPSYVRPMDAVKDKLGPLGKAEKDAVTWLSDVIEEEGKRAQKIIKEEGRLVRPMELVDREGGGSGPLADLEKQAVSFIQQIADSETERLTSGKIRPMMLEESKRGPLGLAEAKAYKVLQDIATSEQDRLKQSSRIGELVRPIDVPGPLGEIEKALVDIFSAEKQRVKDRDNNQGNLVRPKDASITSVIGQAEQNAVKAIDTLREEEEERLKSIQRYLEENRPMEADRESPLGFTEAFVVGLLRAPQLFSSVIDRVKELMGSEKIPLSLSSSSSSSTTNSTTDES